jgi:hypothetical protein
MTRGIIRLATWLFLISIIPRANAIASPHLVLVDNPPICNFVLARWRQGTLSSLFQPRATPSTDSEVDDAVQESDLAQSFRTTRVEIVRYRGQSYVLGLNEDIPRYVAEYTEQVFGSLICEFQSRRTATGRPLVTPLSPPNALWHDAKVLSIAPSLVALSNSGLRSVSVLLDPRTRVKPDPNVAHRASGSLLVDAMNSSRPDALEFFLKRGVDPESAGAGGITALVLAVRNGSMEDVQILLKYGANPDDGFPAQLLIRNLQIEQPSFIERYPSAHQQAMEILDLLLAHGLNANGIIRTVISDIANAKGLKGFHDTVGAPYAATYTPTPVINEVLAAPGRDYPYAAKFFEEVLVYRDSKDCPAGASPEQLRHCLPGALRASDFEVEDAIRQQDSSGNFKRLELEHDRWLKSRDRQCGIRLSGDRSNAWYSFVLDDPKHALCVLRVDTEKLHQLQSMDRLRRADGKTSGR